MSSELFEIPGNPIPEGASTDFFSSRGGKKIRYAIFPARGRPLKGTVILLQGRNECIEKYFETIDDLSARGFGVATLDWVGQGGSARLLGNRLKGHIRRFRDYVQDLDQFMQEIVLPDCRGPFYVVAHSTGALVALLSAPAMVNTVQRMMLCTPLFELDGLPISMKAVGRLTAFLTAIGLGRVYMTGRAGPRAAVDLASNVLTSDKGRFVRNRRLYETYPQLALAGPTVSWVRAACRAAAQVQDPAFMARIQVPILMVAAGADEVVSTRAIEQYAGLLKFGSQLTIDGARHELWQEADLYREQLLAAFDSFIPGSDPAI